MAASSALELISSGQLTVLISTRLAFTFEAAAQKEVYSQKPETIDYLIECVRGFA